LSLSLLLLPPPSSTLFPTRRSSDLPRWNLFCAPQLPCRARPTHLRAHAVRGLSSARNLCPHPPSSTENPLSLHRTWDFLSKKARSEEHTSELQSLAYLVCRLLLEKK